MLNLTQNAEKMGIVGKWKSMPEKNSILYQDEGLYV